MWTCWQDIYDWKGLQLQPRLNNAISLSAHILIWNYIIGRILYHHYLKSLPLFVLFLTFRELPAPLLALATTIVMLIDHALYSVSRKASTFLDHVYGGIVVTICSNILMNTFDVCIQLVLDKSPHHIMIFLSLHTFYVFFLIVCLCAYIIILQIPLLMIIRQCSLLYVFVFFTHLLEGCRGHNGTLRPLWIYAALGFSLWTFRLACKERMCISNVNCCVFLDLYLCPLFSQCSKVYIYILIYIY